MMNEDLKETLWVTWLGASLFFLLIMFILGLVPESRDTMPWWPYFFLLSFINLVICVLCGLKPRP